MGSTCFRGGGGLEDGVWSMEGFFLGFCVGTDGFLFILEDIL